MNSVQRISALPYLAFRFGGRALSASDFVLHGKIVNVGVSLWWWEVWLRLLSKVELNSTILHQDMREQSAACQRLLGCPKSHAQPHSVLRKPHLYLIATVKVLKFQPWGRQKNIMTLKCSYCTVNYMDT